ncbi:chitin synthase chs-2-like [Gigantopelta aegis]|uniref:chitin synthase chs-2-like n=1 Tax=Gigantopelta aegis TaxID=1735272 RepID=UPI001B889809|nr:chitin synthase chs-2-like [Gigantopelta aegis]
MIVLNAPILTQCRCSSFNDLNIHLCLQVACFSVPLLLSFPITVGVLIGSYSGHNELFDFWGSGIRWVETETSIGTFLEHFTIVYWIPVGIGAFVSLIYTAGHIWFPRCVRMATTDKLFLRPLYCGILLEQSMMMNRRRDEDELGEHKVFKEDDDDEIQSELLDPSAAKDKLRTDSTPMIFICATMWHETENEMIQMLKSVFRMDCDQSARRTAQIFFNITDPDYYEFEAHVFFDDAFEAHAHDDYEYKVNNFVKQLIRVMDIAASAVHNTVMKIPPPEKIPTPYGGRLEWKLPGGNLFTAHLKDKAKIRHRKRWSQVMSMYFFLGYRLLAEKIPLNRKQKRAENTFLLALDGDVDFQPHAVQILVDSMKKNRNIGAACGRTHPVGSGPMVWYQKFEYAVGHWLQKSTENTLGCVLCSTGCFSLFRGSALMDDNVMKRYTTPPSEARHYVQYDQGEDRWLCTLLLQQGYRVEYCAASDSFTFAPEGFFEFFNQRRRWTPSTMANILDLIQDWRQTTKKNEDISIMYMFYQLFLFCSSVVTPGTIFMLIVGAFNSVYHFDITVAFVVNLIPVAIFVLLCFKAPSNVHLGYAALLSIIYALVMLVVLVGLIKQIAENGFCSVTTVFVITLAGIFVISAILHPQEFGCLFHGVLYFLSIPSMSMLLMIYSVTNLQIVSWGTREFKTAAPPDYHEEQATTVSVEKNMLHKLMANFTNSEHINSEYVFSFGNLFGCICCPSQEVKEKTMKFNTILERVVVLENRMTEQVCGVNSLYSVSDLPCDSEPNNPLEVLPFSQNENSFGGVVKRENPLYKEEKQIPRDELRNPFWITDEDLAKGNIKVNHPEENEFWEDLISTYLFPLQDDKENEKRTNKKLTELRNTVCLVFVIINALFIILLFALETISEQTGNISFRMPCNIEGLKGEKVQPIVLAFTLVFGIPIVLQFVAMLFHRYSTFLHIAASTELKLKREVIGGSKEQKPSVDETIQLVHDMQAIRDDDEMSIASDYNIEPDYSDVDDEGGLKSTQGNELWANFRGRRKGLQPHRTLNRAFMKNFNRLVSEIKDDDAEENDKEAIHLNAQRKFRRFEKRSVHTIVKMSQADKEYKQSVVKHAHKWNEAVKKLGIKGQLKSTNQLNSFQDVVRAAMIKQGRTKLGVRPGMSQQNTPIPDRRNAKDTRSSSSDPFNERVQPKKPSTPSAWGRLLEARPNIPISKFETMVKQKEDNQAASSTEEISDEEALKEW